MEFKGAALPFEVYFRLLKIWQRLSDVTLVIWDVMDRSFWLDQNQKIRNIFKISLTSPYDENIFS